MNALLTFILDRLLLRWRDSGYRCYGWNGIYEQHLGMASPSPPPGTVAIRCTLPTNRGSYISAFIILVTGSSASHRAHVRLVLP